MNQKYLIVNEAGELLRVKPDTIKERMRLGVFKLGIHYFRRSGRPTLFKRAALVEWVEGGHRESTTGLGPGSPRGGDT